jgi:hypothetical protein
MRRCGFVIVVLSLSIGSAAVGLRAQAHAPGPTFDVVSIKHLSRCAPPGWWWWKDSIAMPRRIGGPVVFDTNELLTLVAPLRVVRYEDTNAKGDFAQGDTRIVRLAAVK